jgi:hypothetical protein
MSTKSRQTLYGISIQMSAERAKRAWNETDRLPAEPGICACLDTRARHNRRRRQAMHRMLVTAILRCGVSAATRIRRLRSILFAARRQRRSANLSAICDASTALSFVNIRASGREILHKIRLANNQQKRRVSLSNNSLLTSFSATREASCSSVAMIAAVTSGRFNSSL